MGEAEVTSWGPQGHFHTSIFLQAQDPRDSQVLGKGTARLLKTSSVLLLKARAPSGLGATWVSLGHTGPPGCWPGSPALRTARCSAASKLLQALQPQLPKGRKPAGSVLLNARCPFSGEETGSLCWGNRCASPGATTGRPRLPSSPGWEPAGGAGALLRTHRSLSSRPAPPPSCAEPSGKEKRSEVRRLDIVLPPGAGHRSPPCPAPRCPPPIPAADSPALLAA